MKKRPQDENFSLLTDAPHGMKLIDDNTTEDTIPSAQQEDLSKETVAPVTSTTKQPIKVNVRVKSIPKRTESTETHIQPKDIQQPKPAELQNDTSDEEIIEISKAEPTSNKVEQVFADGCLPHSEKESDVQQLPVNEKTITKPSHKKWKPILFSAIGVVLVAVITLLIIHFLFGKVEQQDINAIYGCPELYDIEFGTNVDTVDSLIEIEHDTIRPNPFSDVKPRIMLKIDTEFKLYGLPIQNFLCSFDDDKLETVLFLFEKEDVTYKQTIKLYTKIYGQATSSDASETVWSGTKTTITIFNDSEDDFYIVRYAETPNLRFTMLSFDGAEIDPCGFMGDNYIFDKTASHYTTGLQENKDYSMEHYSAAGFASFSKYTLYPSFEYMGIGTGYTAIAFDVDDSEKTIGIVSYLFYLNQQNAVDRIDYIKNALDQAYGQVDSCTYTSTYYSDMGVVDLTFSEAKTKISAGTQGIYNIQWQIDGYNITLGLTIQTDRAYYDGSVAFSIPDPHEHEYTLKSEIAATCDNDGKKEYACDCGDHYSETVKATGHSYSSATCTKAKNCSICGATDGSPLGHSLVDCVCSRCGVVKVSIEQLQGTWRETTYGDYGTCVNIIVISGNVGTVYKNYSDGRQRVYSGTVQLKDYGFYIEGTYSGVNVNGEPYTVAISTRCYISKFSGNSFVDTFDDRGPYTWYKQ